MKFIKLTRLSYEGYDGTKTKEIFVRKSVINVVQKAEGKYVRHKTNVSTNLSVIEVMEELDEILQQLEEPDETNLTNSSNRDRYINNAIPLPLSSRFDGNDANIQSIRANIQSISVPDATGTSSD